MTNDTNQSTPADVVESNGSTSLLAIENVYCLSPSSGTTMTLKFHGSDVSVGQFAPRFMPIGAEAVGDGYDVIWDLGWQGKHVYGVWHTDSNANVVGYDLYGGDEYGLESLETVFHQDLNGDGHVGPGTAAPNLVSSGGSGGSSSAPPTVIESRGTTTLSEDGAGYLLSDSSGNSVTLRCNGAAVAVGQSGLWAPIAAEQTATGYQVVWKYSDGGLYSVWNTDSSGNVISYSRELSQNYSLQSLEASFQQDLNGDGQIGPVKAVIESNGSTSLVNLADNYFFLNSDGEGVSLKTWNFPYFNTEFAPWTPIGVEATSTGYAVVLHYVGSDLYSVWNTDSYGNVYSYAHYSSANYGLQALESTFHQDLNGDGRVGPVTSAIETKGAAGLFQVADQYFLGNGSADGPNLKLNGSAVAVDQLDGWKLLGAEATSTGYAVVLKQPGSDLFSVWNTDSYGNVYSYVHYSSADYGLQSLESTFHQDLNGDGHVGPVTTAIESTSGTGLSQVANEYFLGNGSAEGPNLKLNGGAVVVDQLDGWKLIGAEATSTGYEVVLKQAGNDLYSVWNADSNGNVYSYAHYSGADYGLQSLESTFRQDLNGDGHLGLVTTAIESKGAIGLSQVANEFFLANGLGEGPNLKLNGSAATVDQLDGWKLLGAEATSTGYEVVLKQAGSDLYSLWNTDSYGNVYSYVHYSGNDYGLQSRESTFQQDLNGDGHLGLVTTAIESMGAISLSQVADEYFLGNGLGEGPNLKLNGSAVEVDQIGTWKPIGAEATSTGYEVVFKQAGTDLYSVWNTDSNGNVYSYVHYSGADNGLQSLEPTFHQDLNGDGHLGVL